MLKYFFRSFVLSYLRICAKIQLKKIHPRIVGVAGSSGKTSLTRLIGIVLKTTYSIKNSEGKNSQSGIPLTILGIQMKDYSFLSWLKALSLAKWNLLTNWKKYDVYIAEMGIDSPLPPNNMEFLLQIIQPSIGVVTNVTVEHSVYFDPFVRAVSEKERQELLLEMIAKEETRLLTSLPRNGTAVVNLDDPYIAKTHRITAQKITVSLFDKKADLYCSHLQIDTEKFVMECIYKKQSYILQLPFPLPQHFAYEFLFAIVVGVSMNVTIEAAIAAIEHNFSLPPGRMSLFKGIKNTTIIDSSYNNATLPPILDMLDFLKLLGKKRRKIAIIGDMRELGSQSKENHEIVADKITRTADLAILIGPLMRNYAVPILEKKKFAYKSFLTFTEAKDEILKELKKDDIILVKSSQNTLFLERVVEMLLEDKEDTKKLCRRGEFWDAIRAKTA